MKLTESAYLAVFPIVGIAGAYLIEAGFANYHGIPISLVQLSTAQLVGTAVLVLHIFWFIHLCISSALAAIARQERLLLKHIGQGSLCALLPFVFIVDFERTPHVFFYVAIFFFLPSFIGLARTILMRKKEGSQSFFQRWWNNSAIHFNSEKKNSKGDGLELLIDIPRRWLMFASVFCSLLFTFGYRYASWHLSGTPVRGEPAKVLVAVYGERLFLRLASDAKSPRGTRKDELFILSGDAAKEIVLTFPELKSAN